MPVRVWAIIAAVVILIILALILLGLRLGSRRRPVRIDVRPLPGSIVEGYRARAEELERLFVAQPREATAAAKLLVDDMLVRMGYPIRLTDAERVKDLRGQDPANSERYRVGAGMKGDTSTEQMRRALQAYLEMARDIMNRQQAASSEPGQTAVD